MIEYHAIRVGNKHQLERREDGLRHTLMRDGVPVTLGARSDTPELFTEFGDTCMLHNERWQEQGTVCQGQPGRKSMRHVSSAV